MKNAVAAALLVSLIGCSNSADPRIDRLTEQVKKLTERLDAAETTAEQLNEVISKLKPIAAELRRGRTMPDELQLRKLQIVDEDGTPRIHLFASRDGSQIWLADRKQKRVLLTAMQVDGVYENRIADLTAITVQENGTRIVWQTPTDP